MLLLPLNTELPNIATVTPEEPLGAVLGAIEHLSSLLEISWSDAPK